MMLRDPLIFLCGLHSLALAAFHLAFWKLFRWPESLRNATLANRAIPQIENAQLIWLFLWVAALCFLFPEELRETALGRAVLLGMTGFWVLRVAVQFVWLRVHHPLVHALTAVFATGAALFALASWR
jgi:hypothetical protein